MSEVLSSTTLTSVDVTRLVTELYIPFADEERATSWSHDQAEHQENDAEHSFSLALVGMALIMVVEGNGKFWKENNITYQQHVAKAQEKIQEVASHPAVLGWYQEVLDEVDARKDELFLS